MATTIGKRIELICLIDSTRCIQLQNVPQTTTHITHSYQFINIHGQMTEYIRFAPP